MKVSVKNVLLFTYLFIAIYSYSRLTELFSFLSVVKYIQIGLLLLLIIFTVTQKFTIKKFIFFAFLFIAGLVELNLIGDVTVVFYTVFIFSVKKLDCDEFIRKDMKYKCMFIAGVIIFCLIGFISNYTMVREDGSLRYSMGFNHPNTFAGIMISVLLEWLCIKIKEGIKVRHILVISIALIIIDILANSRTFEISLIITLIAIVAFIVSEGKKKVLNIIFVLMPILFIMLSFIMVLSYNSSNSNWVLVDSFLSHRISFAQNFIFQFKLKMWGQDLGLVGSVQAGITSKSTHILDMGYLRFILQYGIFFSVVLVFILMLDMSYAVKEKNTTMFILLTYLCISAIFESTLGNPIYNFIIPIVTASMLCNTRNQRWNRLSQQKE